jgi:hypothetical protein
MRIDGAGFELINKRNPIVLSVFQAELDVGVTSGDERLIRVLKTDRQKSSQQLIETAVYNSVSKSIHTVKVDIDTPHRAADALRDLPRG